MTRAAKICYQENLICGLNWQIRVSMQSRGILMTCFLTVDNSSIESTCLVEPR